MENLFKDIENKLIQESKQNLPEMQKIYGNSTKYYKQMNLMSKSILIKLLDKAIDEIDKRENPWEEDERDAMDQLCDREFIFEDLVDSCCNDYELWLKEDSNEK